MTEITEIPEGIDFDGILKHVAEALYQAKENGHNRVAYPNLILKDSSFINKGLTLL